MIRTRWWPFAAATGLVVLLAATGVIPTWPGLVHLVALPPLDMFADLRVLLVVTDSWPQFLFLLTVVGACRIALLAWLIGGTHPWGVAMAFYAVTFAPTPSPRSPPPRRTRCSTHGSSGPPSP